MPWLKESKRTFFTDIWRKIFALCLGVLLYFYLYQDIGTMHSIENIPVNISNKDEEYELISCMPENVTLLANAMKLNQSFDPKGFKVTYKLTAEDLMQLRRSTQSKIEIDIYLKNENIAIENGFEKQYKGIKLNLKSDATELDRVKVHLIFDKNIDKRVPVRFVVGELKSSNLRASIKPRDTEEVPMVTLYGRRGKLEDITEVKTNPIDWKLFEGQRRFETRVTLDMAELLKEQIRIDGQSDGKNEGIPVQVELIDASIAEQLPFFNVPVDVLLKSSQEYAVEFPEGVPKVNIVVSCKGNTVHYLRNKPPRAYIDLRSISQVGSQVLPVKITLWNEDGVIDTSISPRTFKVKITRR